MRLLLFSVLLSACKLSSLSSDDLRSVSDHAVFLNITPEAVWVEVRGALGPGGSSLPQAFYRLRTAKQEFSVARVEAQPLRAAPVIFSEVVVAWQSNKDTWLCFLQDVTESRSIDPLKESRCYRQDTQHAYLRQFVEWCVRDNRSDSPFFISNAAPYCKVGKTSASNTVRIPLSCFAGNASMCFPPEKRGIERAGRNAQRVPDKRFKADEYYLGNYLRASGKTFTAVLDDIYAQASDCRDSAGMEVRTAEQGHPFHCDCSQHKNKKITLNSQQRQCNSTGRYYFFAPLKK